jgi:hypothetical protein
MQISLISLAATFAGVFLGAETIRFDATPPGAFPGGWTVVNRHPAAAKWEIRRDPSAPSRPNVLAQVSSDHANDRFPIAILDKANFRDGEVSVKFKTVAGKDEQVAGLLWRYKDPDNYYLVRANSLENNIAMYKIQDGRWIPVTPRGRTAASHNVRHKIPQRTWNILRVTFKKARFEVYFDHRKVFEAEDSTFDQAGKLGLWTKSDSVTYFDDFQFSGK